ncbi:MAG: hypothetical protein A3G75_06205 [Verrucomicrobia bacterium RIFCSPLOWO2_12_FULL_64_8]|nr:MAG: hypothetical protein A3G75_06205 [Verrucomicrobia bacterium RIFCSPLOWO2_12_FULL_64_8]
MRTPRFFPLLLSLALPLAAAPAGDLARLLKDYDESRLQLYPAEGLWRGDYRFLDRYEENLTDAHLAERRRLNAGFRTRLAAIDGRTLSPQDRLSRDILDWDLADEAESLAPGLGERFQLLPLEHFYGRHQSFAQEMQWRGRFPFRTAADYDKAMARMHGFARWIDEAIVRMRQGAAQGVVQPRVIVERMIAQAEVPARTPSEQSVFFGPIAHLPAAIAGDERIRLTAAYRRAIDETVLPAYRRLLTFFLQEYLPRARSAVGLGAMPGGREMYLHLARSRTTTSLPPDEIHAIGLREVERIAAEMERVKTRTGFTGSMEEFRTFLRTVPRFKFKDQAAMLAEFERVKRHVEDYLAGIFGHMPKTPCEIRFFEPFVAPTKAAAEYHRPPADGFRPGIMFINSHDLPSRPTYTTEGLSLHEAQPGHHFQISLAIENHDLPEFRRFGGPTAYVEGWALYCESLGKDLGLYTDPYQEFGELTFEIWRACRLVVDSGMHWKGWSREDAIAYLLGHTSLSETDVVAEVERYIVLPGQALAYKIGQLKLLELRARAQKALGPKFDLRRFHDAVLLDGAMPLSILEAKIDLWIATEKGG